MKPHINTTKNIEKEEISGVKNKKSKDWILEYKWNDKKSHDIYYKKIWWHEAKYTLEWASGIWSGKFYKPEGAKQHAIANSKNRWSYGIKGRQWRARNLKTGEIVEFPELNEE